MKIWEGDYTKHFYWLQTADGERVKCYPNAGLMNAIDGSGRQWTPDDIVQVEPIADDDPDGLHGDHRRYREPEGRPLSAQRALLAAAIMSLSEPPRPSRVDTRGIVGASGRANPRKKAERKRQRKARRKQR